MGKPISEIPPSSGGFMIQFRPSESSSEVLSGNLLHIVGGGDLREPVALVKVVEGARAGELLSVGISRLVTKSFP